MHSLVNVSANPETNNSWPWGDHHFPILDCPPSLPTPHGIAEELGYDADWDEDDLNILFECPDTLEYRNEERCWSYAPDCEEYYKLVGHGGP
jgi:hypothetical protein